MHNRPRWVSGIETLLVHLIDFVNLSVENYESYKSLFLQIEMNSNLHYTYWMFIKTTGTYLRTSYHKCSTQKHFDNG